MAVGSFSQRSLMAKQIELMLGGQMIEVELDPEHYNTAISIAIERLRQRGGGSVKEEDIYLRLEGDNQKYTLPAEVTEVRRLHRRGLGTFGGGSTFDPIESAVFNTTLLHPSQSGGLATWDFYNQYLETAERVFASQFNYTWDNNNKVLTLLKRPRDAEDVLVSVWTSKAEDTLLTDYLTAPWIRSYSIALCKHMLGQARGYFVSGMPGPGGSVQMNGAALIAEAQAEIEKLDLELYNNITGGGGYGIVIG
jgi:hypothetical protein